MKIENLLAPIAFASALMVGIPGSAHAVDLNVYDANRALLGPLISQNHVGLTLNGQLVSAPVKSAGFKVDFDDNKFVRFYYETADCSGAVYYSDQADGEWEENDTPSIFDLPLQGILVGTVPSPLDTNFASKSQIHSPEFYSEVVIYYPDPGRGLTEVNYQSARNIGSMSLQSACIQTKGHDLLATMISKTISGTPPFNVR